VIVNKGSRFAGEPLRSFNFPIIC